MSYGVTKPEISSPKHKIKERRYIFLLTNILIDDKINLLKIWWKIRTLFYFKYNTLICIHLVNYNTKNPISNL